MEFQTNLKQEIKELIPRYIGNVIALGPMLITALNLINDRYSTHANLTIFKDVFRPDFMEKYRSDMVRFIRSNYEIFLHHFKTTILS